VNLLKSEISKHAKNEPKTKKIGKQTPYLGSQIAVQLFGRGPWDLIGPKPKNDTLPGALLGPKPQIFTLPGTPPRSLKAKSKNIKKPLVLPS
jgi:hypothetical protein